MARRRSHDALRARDRGRAGIPLVDTPEDHSRSVQRYGCLQDDPTFYTARHLRCLCPTRRQHHRPSALCPSLPRWMTLTLPQPEANARSLNLHPPRTIPSKSQGA